jgi:DnaJ like chaperone protein
MGFSKWIGASIGWSFGGPIGAIIGMAVGSLLDSSSKSGSSFTQSEAPTRSGDFEVSLLVLASIVIKADGKQDQRENGFCTCSICSNVWKGARESSIQVV